MALLMGVCLIRSSQVLASFRRTHVLKLSLPCELHRCFFLVIQLTASHSSSCCNRKGLQGQKFFKFLSPRGIAMTPKKEWQMDSSSSVHCKPLLCHRQESSWKRSRLQIRPRIVIMCFISWSDDSVLPKTNVAWWRKKTGAEPDFEAVLILGSLGEVAFCFRASAARD